MYTHNVKPTMSDSLKTKHAELKTLANALDYNHARVVSGVKSAHTAYRSQLQQIKKLCDVLRKATLENQKSLPTKKRGSGKAKEKAAETTESDDDDSGVAEEPATQPEVESEVSESDEEPAPKPKKKGRRKTKKAK